MENSIVNNKDNSVEEVTFSHSSQQTKNRKMAFLTAFAEVGTIVQAAEIAEIDRTTHYDWMKNDPEYVKAFIQAEEKAAERLEQEARRRAVEGVQKSVFYKGEECGVVTEYSDTLLIFLLKGAKPEKYKERISNEVSVAQPSTGSVNTLKQLKEQDAEEGE